MNAIRKILMPLLVIPFGMFMVVFTHPDWQLENPGLESLFALIGIPILIVNFIAWFYPEIIKVYFPVKEEWGERGEKLVTLAIAISMLIAFTCVGVGAVSAIATGRSHPGMGPSALQPATATAVARAIDLLASPTPVEETAVVSTLTESPQVNLLPEQTSQIPNTGATPEPTPQIPISGGALIGSPTRSTSATRTEVTAASTSTALTGTAASSSGLCTPATSDYQDAISQTVQDWDPNNEVSAAWAVQSRVAANLWFVAAKISGPEIDSGLPPGVWGVFTDSNGNFNIYAVNDTAIHYSGADNGDNSDPVLTMQSDGAQAASNCVH